MITNHFKTTHKLPANRNLPIQPRRLSPFVGLPATVTDVQYFSRLQQAPFQRNLPSINKHLAYAYMTTSLNHYNAFCNLVNLS